MLFHSNFYCDTFDLGNITISGSQIYSNDKHIFTLLNFPLLDNIFEPHIIKNTNSIDTYIKSNISKSNNYSYTKNNLDKVCLYFKYNNIDNYNYNIRSKLLNYINQNFIDNKLNTNIKVMCKNLLCIDNIYIDKKKKKITSPSYNYTKINSIIVTNCMIDDYLSLEIFKIDTYNKFLNVINKKLKLNINTVVIIYLNIFENINNNLIAQFYINIGKYFKIFILNTNNIIKNIYIKDIIKFSNVKKIYYDQYLIDSYMKNNIYNTQINDKIYISSYIEIKMNNLELSYCVDNINNKIICKDNFSKYGYNILASLNYIGININTINNYNNSEKCCISMDDINNYNRCLLDCGHVFSSSNIIYNLLKNIQCPLCRNKIKRLNLTISSIPRICSKIDYILNNLNNKNKTILFLHKANYNFYDKLSNKLNLNCTLLLCDNNMVINTDNVYVYEGESHDNSIFNKNNIENVKNIYFMKNIS